MKKSYIFSIIGLVIIALGVYWLYANKAPNTTDNKTINKSQHTMSNKQMTYIVSNADLNVSGSAPEFKHMPKPGASKNIFIIMISESKYLITQFSWMSVPNPTATLEENSTYLFENGKFTPVKAELSYSLQNNILEGTFAATGGQPVSVHTESGDTTEINSAGDFAQVKGLPGFENAVYTEVQR